MHGKQKTRWLVVDVMDLSLLSKDGFITLIKKENKIQLHTITKTLG